MNRLADLVPFEPITPIQYFLGVAEQGVPDGYLSLIVNPVQRLVLRIDEPTFIPDGVGTLRLDLESPDEPSRKHTDQRVIDKAALKIG